MKRVFFLIYLFVLPIYSQNEGIKNAVSFDGTLKIKLTRYFYSGNNFLADANEARLGYGLEFGVVKYQQLSLSALYDFVSFKTTNSLLTGNVGSTRQSVFGFNVLYEIPIVNDFSLQPFVGLGAPVLNFKSSGRSFGKQSGTDYKIGLNLNCKVNKSLFFYLGTEYVRSAFVINTVPEFVEYFGAAESLRINIGIGF